MSCLGKLCNHSKSSDKKAIHLMVLFTVCCISLWSRTTREIRDSLFGVTRYVTIGSLSFRCTSPEGIKRLCCNNFGLRFSPASPLYTARSGQPNYFIVLCSLIFVHRYSNGCTIPTETPALCCHAISEATVWTMWSLS